MFFLFFQIVEEPDSGTIPISFPISRMFGSIGMLNIFWSVTSENRLSGAAGDDVTKVNGERNNGNGLGARVAG